jgi:hypothetical protein
MRIAALVLAMIPLAAASMARAQIADSPQAGDFPIIAQLYSDPARYSGRSVTIYGLVIESISDSVFMLQDVSQHPLKVIGNDKLKAAVGDQLIVLGLFHTGSEGPYISANSLIPTQVVAGGGCC